MSVQEFVTPVRIIDGKLKVENRAHLDAGLKEMRNGGYLLRIERMRATRSNAINAAYWVGYVGPMADHTGYTPLEMHAFFKSQFLPKTHLVIQDKDGVVMDEADVASLTTTTLTQPEFSRYLKDIEALALTLGVRVGSYREE